MYQIYPRSFSDSDSDGTGDLGGVFDRLPYLKDLGVDALWFNPWYPSPLADGGYDVSDYRDILPDFGDLAQAQQLVATAHELGFRMLIDLVPNHCRVGHPWFDAALKAGRNSAERDLFIFRDGIGADHDQPTTNWSALFGGSSWQRVVTDGGSAPRRPRSTSARRC
ncbi:MAG: alpha-amylase family glycosyl hydrolase [Propionibacteriaceae bacterium]